MKYIHLPIIVFAIFATTAASGMSFFKTKEVEAVLFSEMSGTVTYNGEPQKGVSLELSITWNEDETIAKNFTTNDDGYFSIPEIQRKITTHPLVQLVIRQTVTVRHNGESYHLWIRSKLYAGEPPETEQKPQNLRCELTDPLVRIEVESGLLGTPCKWENAE